MQKTSNDVARIYLARDHDTEPKVIIADLREKKVFIEGKENIPITSAVNGNKMEIELPFDMLALKNQQSFYVNVTRDYDNTTTYWLGNSHSVMDPIVYANFILWLDCNTENTLPFKVLTNSIYTKKLMQRYLHITHNVECNLFG